METVVYKLSEKIGSPLAEDFKLADKVSFEIEKAIRAGAKVIVDMEGITLIAPTFAHVAFSQLYRSFPRFKVKKRLAFIGIPANVEKIVKGWIEEYRTHYSCFYKNELSEEELVLYPGVVHAFTPTFEP